jgi:hypothetical protein
MDIAAILSSKYTAEWILNGDDYEGLDWLSETPKKPTLAKLTEFWPEVQAAQLAQAEAKVAARESALAKLSALGLTAEEIGAL